jgi:hypothetical protein
MTDTPPRPDARSGRRDLADIFGDVLPETTADDRLGGADGTDEERWYHENRPPHHERS